MSSAAKKAVFWLTVVVSAFLLWQTVKSGGTAQAVPEISYTEFLARVASGQVSKVTIAGGMVRGYGANGSFRVIAPSSQAALLDTLQQHGVEIWFKEAPEQSWPSWILNLLPLILLGALWLFMIRQMQRLRSGGDGPSNPMPPQESKPRFGS
jgi:cell division protease FtsH